MSQMAEDVRQLLDFLGLEKVVLGGLSMGGYVALEFYNLFPERVSALVLADTKAAADAEEARKKRFETAEMLMREGIEPLVKEMLPKVFAPVTLENSAETVNRAREMMRTTMPASAAAASRGMAERNDHTALLEKINVPTLIIVGEEDALTPPAEAEKMRQAIKNSQLVKIADAGHLSPMEKPDEVNRALLGFLESL
jgi:pimeloyl-ACP methyl ester carboxylesterase